MTRDNLDNRVLGAVRFIDAISGTPVTGPLTVTAEGVRIIRNRSSLYVIAEAPSTAAYSARFQLPEPPAPALPPAIGSVKVTLTVIDPSGVYLPRTATIDVPRDPDPTKADQPSSLFQPVDRELFPSPIARVAEGWAALRLSIKKAGSDSGLPYAYVRVRRSSNDSLLARGIADERGEMLVGVPGIPVTTWSASSGSPVTTSTIHVRVVAYFDRDAFDPTAGTYPDPDAFDSNLATLPHSSDVELDLASGREVTRRIDVTTPP